MYVSKLFLVTKDFHSDTKEPNENNYNFVFSMLKQLQMNTLTQNFLLKSINQVKLRLKYLLTNNE